VVRFSSLVDPEAELPAFITKLTGITTNDVKHAPTFHQIADELASVLDGAVFVAHNVRFDYSFLKSEFKRVNKQFLPKQLCTVKLSRTLFPDMSGHKLADLIARYGFTYQARHRAYDDAHVLWQFIQYIHQAVAVEVIEAAVTKQLGHPAIPQGIPHELVNNLPTGPGVYIFEDDGGRPLYVGKSINIRKRVLQHFGNDTRDSKEFKIAQLIHHIRTETTSGELSALLLESQRVKELQPLYNRQLRKLSKLTIALETRTAAGYSAVRLEEATADELAPSVATLATYPRRSRARESLLVIARTYALCPQLMGLEKGSGACFWYQLHKCRGACIGLESADSYNDRLLRAFERRKIQSWPFKGAVLVQEKVDAIVPTNGIVVDQWRVVAEVSQEAYCEPRVIARPAVFDLDTYKILQSFLTNHIKQLSIKPLSSSQLLELGI
jgi:DNA polymerase-3 subunit epsilon